MAGVCTFSGNVTIGGTLTYEDVTNIDSVGIITANTGINVVANGINVQAAILTAKNIIDATNAQRNTRVGTNAGNSFDGTTAEDNTLIGYDAGTAITTGDKSVAVGNYALDACLLYTSPSPRDVEESRMPSSA